MVKYQIFISSTFEDLKPERDQVIKAVLEMGHIPVGMEMFSAGDDEQWEVIRKQIDESDYYVVIVAHRYGSMDGNISYTEKEYDYAASQKIPVLGFVLEEGIEWPTEWRENNRDIQKRLEAFRAKVSGRMVSSWMSADDLYGRAGIALMKAFSTHPREGWVRSSSADTGEMSEELTRLSRENRALREAVSQLRTSHAELDTANLDQTIDALRLNRRRTYVWLQGADDWGDPIDTSLLELFEAMCPDLIDEASSDTISSALGLRFGGLNLRRSFPVPANFVKAYIADLVSLDLVGTSPKRHSVNDTKAYWSLTDFGRQVHGRIRRNELLRGLAAFDEAPTDSVGPEAGTAS